MRARSLNRQVLAPGEDEYGGQSGLSQTMVKPVTDMVCGI
jgi:hypothetical protein